MCGPTVMACASEEQKRRYLPPLASGEEIWCQLFSEPAGGSDLAGLRTRAERQGEDWIINGQKIWTSGAQFSDLGILITRTDPTVPKHKGLTMFFLDMKSPGVEIRPIKQANGQSGFNEVYFTDVRIPDSQRLGEVGGGWEVSLTTLMNERLSIGAGMSTGFPELFDFCCRFATADGPAVDDRAVRSRLATWAVRASGLKYTGFRAISALSKGETPGPENSIGKLVAGTTMQEIAMFALDLQGQMGVHIDPDDAAASRFQAMLLRSPATRIEGGTDEILRNIIAERVLGLPGDIRVDKDVAFNQHPDHDPARAFMTSGILQVAKEGAVDWVTLNRPERLNALNPALVDELLDYLPQSPVRSLGARRRPARRRSRLLRRARSEGERQSQCLAWAHRRRSLPKACGRSGGSRDRHAHAPRAAAHHFPGARCRRAAAASRWRSPPTCASPARARA